MDKRLKSEIKYYVFYKPYNVLNQFTKEMPEHVTLANFLKVEKDIYPVGRLDKDSEGLLILTNDSSLNALLLSPSQGHKRTYAVQLDFDITPEAIAKVAKGVEIKIDSGTYLTKPCTVKKLSKPPVLPERNPPIRVRQNIPTSWALIELTEGKNRQVRKMFAAVGFPVLRLVRVQIENLKLGKLEPGKHIEIEADELFKLIKIDPSAKVRKKPSKPAGGYDKTLKAKSKASTGEPTTKETKESAETPKKSTFANFRGDKKPRTTKASTKKSDDKASDYKKSSSYSTDKKSDKPKSYVRREESGGPTSKTSTSKPKKNKRSKSYPGKPESPKQIARPKKFEFKKQ